MKHDKWITKADDYLSREEILRVFDNLTVKNPDDKYQHGMQDAIDCLIPEVINGMEAADVQPVKHGKWIGVDYDTYFECSECKHMTDWQLYKYCPCCGAKMNGEEANK